MIILISYIDENTNYQHFFHSTSFEMISSSDVYDLNVADLKKELRQRSLPINGNKADLQKRLFNTLLSNEGSTDAILTTEPGDVESKTYLKRKDFDMFFNEYTEFKKYIVERENNTCEDIRKIKVCNEEIMSLRAENKSLKDELNSRQNLIDDLLKQLS